MADSVITWDHGVALLVVDGLPQSVVDPADPLRLDFEYVRRFALAVDALCPPGPLRVTHVGGGALTFPRWVQATRPGSPQLVLEPDEELTERVRADLPLPRGHRIRVRPVTGQVGLMALAASSADVVVVDAYAAGRVPPGLVTTGWLARVARVLTPSGLLLANLADEPARTWTARVLAGMAAAGLTDIDLLATPDILKGHRFGNVVAVARRRTATGRPEDPTRLAVAAARAGMPGSVRDGRPLALSARAFTEQDALPSPAPPDPGRWRVR